MELEGEPIVAVVPNDRGGYTLQFPAGYVLKANFDTPARARTVAAINCWRIVSFDQGLMPAGDIAALLRHGQAAAE